jgi:hypothetical protein
MKQIALLFACTLSFLSCKKNATSYSTNTQVMVSLPNVSTSNITSVRETSAIAGGDVVSAGNSFVTARGVCWSSSHSPTIADDTTSDGSVIGIFVSRITHLLPKTTYYVRAYASNNAGTAYGKENSFTTASPPSSATGSYYGTYSIAMENRVSYPPGNR